MFNSKKLLTVVFVILLVILLAEIGYLVYSALQQPKVSDTPSDLVLSKETPPPGPKRGGSQAIRDSVLNYLSNLNLGVTTASTVQITFQGTIIELDTNRLLRIRLRSDDGSTNTFTYFEHELPKIKVFRATEGGNTEAVSIADLKIEDKITMDQSLNLLEDLNTGLLEVIIIIFNP